jgi:hypothetical protein
MKLMDGGGYGCTLHKHTSTVLFVSLLVFSVVSSLCEERRIAHCASFFGISFCASDLLRCRRARSPGPLSLFNVQTEEGQTLWAKYGRSPNSNLWDGVMDGRWTMDDGRWPFIHPLITVFKRLG